MLTQLPWDKRKSPALESHSATLQSHFLSILMTILHTHPHQCVPHLHTFAHTAHPVSLPILPEPAPAPNTQLTSSHPDRLSSVSPPSRSAPHHHCGRECPTCSLYCSMASSSAARKSRFSSSSRATWLCRASSCSAPSSSYGAGREASGAGAVKTSLPVPEIPQPSPCPARGSPSRACYSAPSPACNRGSRPHLACSPLHKPLGQLL